MIIDDINQEKLARMLEAIALREMSRTQELPVVVDVMVKHEIILSCVEGLVRSAQLSEFELAFGSWQANRRMDVAITATLPAIAASMGASCWT